MVDFQSRDTSRGLSSDDDEAADEDEPAGESETGETADETAGSGTEEAADETAEPETDETVESEEVATAANTDDHDQTHADDHDQTHADDETHSHGGGHAHADHHHGDVEELGLAVVTVTSSRDLDDDPSGDAIQSLLEGGGHSVVARDLVADDLDGVQRAVLALTGRNDVDAVVTTGGTGITPDDVTIEAVRPLFDKELPGFGELFRILSYEEVGTAAIGSRATAGVSEGVPVFCLPGSEDAVRTAVEELILAEAPHLAGLARGE